MNTINSCCIIDDDPIFIYGTKRIMKEVNFCNSVSIFNNGEDAINGLKNMYDSQNSIPQVIFLDLNMPVMNGWEFLEEFIKIPHHNLEKTLVYIISSSVDPRDINRVKEYNFIRNYILKPITPNDLERILLTYTI